MKTLFRVGRVLAVGIVFSGLFHKIWFVLGLPYFSVQRTPARIVYTPSLQTWAVSVSLFALGQYVAYRLLWNERERKPLPNGVNK